MLHPVQVKSAADSGRRGEGMILRRLADRDGKSNEHRLKPVLLAAHRAAGYNSPVPPVSQTIRVKVLFFGRLKELIGRNEESVEVFEHASIEQLFAIFLTRNPELAKYRSSLVASRNQEFAAWDTQLHAGDEVAFLPPVSGG
jgi:molybdopterin synthase sulfur carrier subunit